MAKAPGFKKAYSAVSSDPNDCECNKPSSDNNGHCVLHWRKYKRLSTTIRKAAEEVAELMDVTTDDYFIKETKNYIAIHVKDSILANYMHRIIDEEVNIKNRAYAEDAEVSSNSKIKRLEAKVDACVRDVEKVNALYSDIRPLLENISELDD
jgi:molybdopterin-biosynthesis enzyme MoeA-like protein